MSVTRYIRGVGNSSSRNYLPSMYDAMKFGKKWLEGRAKGADNKRKRESAAVQKQVNKKHKVNGTGAKFQVNKISSGQTDRIPNVTKKRGAKRVAYKQKPYLKVNKKFAKKVKIALEKEAIRGSWYSVYQDTINYPAFINAQGSNYLGHQLFTTEQGLYFSPNQVLNAASVLWNQKTPIVNPIVTDSGNFSYSNVVINVINSWVDFELKNNGQRTVKLIFYDFALKGPANVNVATAIVDPFNTWNNCLTEENLASINIGNATSGTLYQKPTMCKSFNNIFKTMSWEVILEPGQTYNYRLQGPQNYKYDFAKFSPNTGDFQNQQKMCRWVLVNVILDLVTNTVAAASSRSPNSASTIYQTISVEAKVNFKLSMPEQVGFTYPSSTATGLQQTLGARHEAKAFYIASGAGTGVVRRFDEEQPVSVETL